MGRNTGDFFDGGASARMDSSGAMEATNKFEGPSAIPTNTTQNDFAGHTAGQVAYEGTGA